MDAADGLLRSKNVMRQHKYRQLEDGRLIHAGLKHAHKDMAVAVMAMHDTRCCIVEFAAAA